MNDKLSCLKTIEMNSFTLSVCEDAEGGACVRPQTPDGHMLSTLVHLDPPRIARLALDLVFKYWFNVEHLDDALNAYASCPLENPPAEYLDICLSHDFRLTDQRELSAIVLAGQESQLEKLLSILDQLLTTSREAALFAASTFRSQRLVDKVARLSMDVQQGDGDGRAFAICFERWLNRHVVDWDRLESLLNSYERTHPQYLKARDYLGTIGMWRCLYT